MVSTNNQNIVTLIVRGRSNRGTVGLILVKKYGQELAHFFAQWESMVIICSRYKNSTKKFLDNRLGRKASTKLKSNVESFRIKKNFIKSAKKITDIYFESCQIWVENLAHFKNRDCLRRDNSILFRDVVFFERLMLLKKVLKSCLFWIYRKEIT